MYWANSGRRRLGISRKEGRDKGVLAAAQSEEETAKRCKGKNQAGVCRQKARARLLPGIQSRLRSLSVLLRDGTMLGAPGVKMSTCKRDEGLSGRRGRGQKGTGSKMEKGGEAEQGFEKRGALLQLGPAVESGGASGSPSGMSDSPPMTGGGTTWCCCRCSLPASWTRAR